MKHLKKLAGPGFTLIELLVVIVIIAVLAGLIFPVMGKVRLRSLETRTTSNLRQVASAMGAYGADHSGMLPGPLSVEQYPGFGADAKRDAGSLARLLSTYLGLVERKSADEVRTKGTDVLACPLIDPPKDGKLDDVAGYIMNMELVHDYEQPAWGDLKDDKQPLNRSALSAWRDTKPHTETTNGTVNLALKWAMRHTDQLDCKNIPLDGDFVDKLPKEPVFPGEKISGTQYGRYQTLFFDLHVDAYEPAGKDYLNNQN